MSEAEDNNKKYESIQLLRNKILETPDFESRTDDFFLLRFLWTKKFDQKRAFKLLNNYYSVRKRHCEIFDDFVPSSIEDVLQSGVFEVLEEPDQLNRTIVIGRAYKWDVSVHSVTKLLKSLLVILETVLENEDVQMNGIVIIYDVSGLTWRHCLQFTPRMIYQIKVLLENTFPARYKGIHIVNLHTLAKGVLTLTYPILSAKMRKRLYLHCSSMEYLHQFISPEKLPEQYGGNLKDNNNNEIFVSKILKFEEMLQSQQRYWCKN